MHSDSEKVFSLLSRLFVWGTLVGVLYVLRSFFLLIFLTFVFAYVQSRAEVCLLGLVPNRTVRVVLVGLAFLAGVVALGGFILPAVGEQAKVLANSYPVYLRSIDVEILRLKERHPLLEHYLPSLPSTESNGASWSQETSASYQLFQQLLGIGSEDGGDIRAAFETLRDVGSYILAIVSAFLLSLLFSFLIVLDLPRLAAAIRGLKDTRVRFIYNEVAPSISSFSRVMGQALEAQFFIAFANTILTSIGLWVLGLTSKLALIAMIVFFLQLHPNRGCFHQLRSYLSSCSADFWLRFDASCDFTDHYRSSH